MWIALVGNLAASGQRARQSDREQMNLRIGKDDGNCKAFQVHVSFAVAKSAWELTYLLRQVSWPKTQTCSHHPPLSIQWRSFEQFSSLIKHACHRPSKLGQPALGRDKRWTLASLRTPKARHFLCHILRFHNVSYKPIKTRAVLLFQEKALALQLPGSRFM